MTQISSAHMRDYETIFVLRPDVEDETAVEFLKKMMALVEGRGGKHVKMTNWGRRKLGWERNRHQKGMFVHHHYLGKSDLVKEYERTLGLDENVLLRQTIVLNKSVAPDDVPVEEDVLQPPVQKETRRDEGRDRDHRDRDRRPAPARAEEPAPSSRDGAAAS